MPTSRRIDSINPRTVTEAVFNAKFEMANTYLGLEMQGSRCRLPRKRREYQCRGCKAGDDRSLVAYPIEDIIVRPTLWSRIHRI